MMNKKKKNLGFVTKVLLEKSGDDLLSHNVAGKRVKHQACLSVLQRAEATSWNNYMQCTSCLQYNELQGLPSQGGIIEKEAPNFRLELPSKSGDDLLSHKSLQYHRRCRA